MIILIEKEKHIEMVQAMKVVFIMESAMDMVFIIIRMAMFMKVIGMMIKDMAKVS